MNILVTGGAGYLGSVLIPKLLARGHRVRVLDLGYFGLGHLRALRPSVEVIREDLRALAAAPAQMHALLDGCDVVIHLAAVSNDPSAELNPGLTEEVNFHATIALAEAARALGVKFLFSSSCSVYGEAEGELDEESWVNPLTAYASSKVKAEQGLSALAQTGWRPVILRNGTLFGYSPRMRFDLVVNIFSLYSTLHNEIKIFGDGQQWRPFLHVSDCARAFVFFTEQPEQQHLCYNIAHENLRVVDIAARFMQLNPSLQATHVETPDEDRRDYRVSTERIGAEGFRTRTGVEVGAEEMIEAIINGLIPDPESIFYRNAKWLKELTQIGSKNHRDIVSLLETLSHLNLPTRV
ncbi:MAG TPA: SDR family oxidoreductase [Pyrinomonadaceae bacterium]|jgi:nucleoside-diphosphate-sugar epimerase